MLITSINNFLVIWYNFSFNLIQNLINSEIQHKNQNINLPEEFVKDIKIWMHAVHKVNGNIGVNRYIRYKIQYVSCICMLLTCKKKIVRLVD